MEGTAMPADRIYDINLTERIVRDLEKHMSFYDRIRGQNVVFPNDPTTVGSLPQTRQGEKTTS